MMPPFDGRFKVRKRIPGPISLLDIKPSSSSRADAHDVLGQHDIIELPHSQTDNDPVTFQTGPWLSAWFALGLPPFRRGDHLDAYELAIGNGLLNTPLRLLSSPIDRERSGVCLVKVESIQHHADKDATVTLVDPTGSAQGYVHCKLLEEYGPEFASGAVLLLRNAVLVHNRGESGGVFLNVTPDNVAMLWSASTSFSATQQTMKRSHEYQENPFTRTETESRQQPNDSLEVVDDSTPRGTAESSAQKSTDVQPGEQTSSPKISPARRENLTPERRGLTLADARPSEFQTSAHQSEDDDWMWEDGASSQVPPTVASGDTDLTSHPLRASHSLDAALVGEEEGRPDHALKQPDDIKKDEDDDILDLLLDD